MMTPEKLIKLLYDSSVSRLGSEDIVMSSLKTESIKVDLSMILEKSESSKAVLTVIITSCIYKILHPEQDIKNHQSSIKNGYSGRSFDTKYVTPFLKSIKFPSMSESGWLTRSLEQKVPYNNEYTGAIKPIQLKSAFLNAIEFINTDKKMATAFLDHLFQGLLIKRNKQEIDLAKPISPSISITVEWLKSHFNNNYVSDGASRLPVLALYAAYKCLVKETYRFEGKKLLEIENHTSSDARSGRIGDIDVLDSSNQAFEAVEVKHNIAISVQLVKDAFQKFKGTQVKRYYLLSTIDSNLEAKKEISEEIIRIKNRHGCQVIVNGVVDSLKYYLRFISDTSDFISHYVDLVEKDKSIKFEHKERWNSIISNYG